MKVAVKRKLCVISRFWFFVLQNSGYSAAATHLNTFIAVLALKILFKNLFKAVFSYHIIYSVTVIFHLRVLFRIDSAGSSEDMRRQGPFCKTSERFDNHINPREIGILFLDLLYNRHINITAKLIRVFLAEIRLVHCIADCGNRKRRIGIVFGRNGILFFIKTEYFVRRRKISELVFFFPHLKLFCLFFFAVTGVCFILRFFCIGGLFVRFFCGFGIFHSLNGSRSSIFFYCKIKCQRLSVFILYYRKRTLCLRPVFGGEFCGRIQYSVQLIIIETDFLNPDAVTGAVFNKRLALIVKYFTPRRSNRICPNQTFVINLGVFRTFYYLEVYKSDRARRRKQHNRGDYYIKSYKTVFHSNTPPLKKDCVPKSA